MTPASAPARPAGTGAPAGFVVASSCPRCGAPLDFAAGSNAVRCAHCAAMLLVTGRGHVLSYVIRARVTPSEARTLAGFTRPAKGARSPLAEPCLTYVPYYRLSAEEVFWHRERRPARRPAIEPDDADDDALLSLVAGAAHARQEEHAVVLASRAIERSFLACDPGELARWSLGVRTGVLRLDLLQRAELEPGAVVLRPALAAEAALARALEPLAEVELLHREVLRAVLSLVYFPLWTVAAGAGVTVIDGITGALVARAADPAPLAALAGAGAATERVLGFRALCCPDCGWDLPVRPRDVVFHCASCERTWELVGEDLEPIGCSVLAGVVGSHAGEGARRHLPVWQVDGGIAAAGRGASLPQRAFAPAFRWRAPKSLCDIGMRLARALPAQPEVARKDVPLLGCALDRVDALAMARLVSLRVVLGDAAVRRGAASGAGLPAVTIDAPRVQLLWLPVAGDAYSVRDPFTGYALPRRAVDEALS